MHSKPEFCYFRIKYNSLLSTEDAWKDDCEDLNDQKFKPNNGCEETFSLRSISLIKRELPAESSLGWPLLRRTHMSHQVLSSRRGRNMSVVEWVMSLHSRSSSIASHSAEDESTDSSRNPEDEGTYRKPCALEEACAVREGVSIDQNDESTSAVVYGWPLLRIAVPVTSDSLGESEDKIENHHQRQIPYPVARDDENNLTPSTELFLKLVSSNYKQFSYEELMQATSQFSSDNLIGEGGSSNVYKGCLSDGKQVAVKVLKSCKEAWNDFSLEVDITSSLKHKSITTLIGLCTEDGNLILVSDFFPKGTLEESLHGSGKQSVVPWEVRFDVAVATAEALNYLHNECPRPVIHRDVKSSNILLSNEFQPQLSDFGLAIWGPTDSTYMIHEDVVGTFGYIAPEYFMRGKVSDKIDVYSFGVVLLELLSGRRPLPSRNLKGQESLIKWAKPILKNGEAEALLDPKLNTDYDTAQMQRMVLAANLCITQSPRFRPNMNQILKLLRGETDAKEWVDSHIDDVKRSGNQEDDDSYDFGGKPRLDFSILDIDSDAISLNSIIDDTSLIGTEQKQQHLELRDYLIEKPD